ncbi:ribosomal protein S5 domain 2-type protein [Vararia minispora EC-137]|uniref:Ribosomal protein S5 domain 2-type protein n=1 Tax=Vararia minispora EC-137 TaxID=1314806 RepID=A0ACB8Q580_9AGAM|nr:ribosomal protein S5 domain 2-type protein [Vararia minispora EC-137]
MQRYIACNAGISTATPQRRTPFVAIRHLLHLVAFISCIEILNDASLRSDGRRPTELRAPTFEVVPGGANGADGSASASMGLTSVRVEVFGPREGRSRAQALHNRASVSVEVAGRRRRGRGDRRVAELASSLRDTFQPAILTALYPRAQIDIHVHILAHDGALLSTCINVTSLALLSAGVPMRDLVAAVTAGVHGSTVLCDLTALEEADMPSATVAVLPRSGKVALVGMETRLHVERFGEMFDVARRAAGVLCAEMRAVARGRAREMLDATDSGPAVPREGENDSGAVMMEE